MDSNQWNKVLCNLCKLGRREESNLCTQCTDYQSFHERKML